jgi:hypothetical protein
MVTEGRAETMSEAEEVFGQNETRADGARTTGEEHHGHVDG